MCFRFLQVAWIYVRTGELPGMAIIRKSRSGIGVTSESDVPAIAVVLEGA